MAFTTINKSTDYFDTKLYTGNNTSQSITGLNFKPDWCWIKSRSNTEKHVLQDVLIGTGYELTSQDTSAQNPTSTSITSFNSDGITVGSANAVNDNSINYVNWNWKANGQGSANTDGSINTTYTSANTTSGFSISQYTGTGATATVGHGLGVVPKVVLIKGTSNTGSWGMYHASVGADKKMILNTTGAEASSGWMNSTAPTSSVFTVINDADVGSSGYTYVAYCFAEKQGFSKFGSYTGNGSTDGAFVYTGFKPSWVIFKKTSGTGGWNMFDTKRDPFNVQDQILRANANNAEASDSGYSDNDFLSNGFKLRQTWGEMNGSGATYIYMAFAEAPLVGTNNVPANAR
jgi:hypothetical protein